MLRTPSRRSRTSRSTVRSASLGMEMLERRTLMSATISGAVMQDLSGNGLSADDQPLAGIVVKLYADQNGNGQLDAGDGAAIASQASAAVTGAFSFTGLAKGKYLLQDVPGANQIRTAPALGDTLAINVTKNNKTYSGNLFDNYLETFDKSALSNITYTINGATTVTTLTGNVHQGDTVTANFTVAAGETVTLSLVSYHASAPFSNAQNLQDQSIFDLATGTFSAGQHTLTVLIPDCYFQVDFSGGLAISPFGPAGSNILYGAQKRLINFDNGGTNPCTGDIDHEPGRMTGGGSIILGDGTRVTHGFELHCAQKSAKGGPIEDVNNHLEINWSQSSFHLLDLTSVACFDTPLDQGHPTAPIDTLTGVGDGRFSGTFNGQTYKNVDAKIEFTLTDAGEPGTSDTADFRIVVLDANQDGVANDPVVVLDTSGGIKLTFGNQQAHKEIPPLSLNSNTAGVLN